MTWRFRVLAPILGLIALAATAAPAAAQISKAAGPTTVTNGYVIKFHIAYDSVNQVYLAVWDGANGLFLDKTGHPIGSPFFIGTGGWTNVTFGGTPAKPRFLVTYLVPNGSTNPKIAQMISYSAGGVPVKGPPITVTNIFGEWTDSELSQSIWTGSQFILSWRVGTNSVPAYPFGNTALIGMDVDGNFTTQMQLLGDNQDHEVNANLACGPTVCLAVGFGVGIPFGSHGGSWARRFDPATLAPIGSVFYLDTHDIIMEDQRVAFNEKTGQFQTAWVRGRQKTDFRLVGTDGAAGPLDLTKSLSAGQLSILGYNTVTRTSLLSLQSGLDAFSFELNDSGYPTGTFLQITDGGIDRNSPSYYATEGINNADSQWLVMYSNATNGRTTLVQGTPSNAPGQLTSPTAGSQLGTSATFQWSAGIGVTSYTLSLGSTAGGTDIFNQNQGANQSVTVSSLPHDGRKVYARLTSTFAGSAPQSFDYTFTAVLLVPGDYNGDGKLDLIWRNGVTGVNAVWFMNSTALLSQGALPALADANWFLAATTDLNQDYATDLIWRNGVTGANMVWFLTGSSLVSSVALPAVPDLNWQLAAAADVNLDGYPDLIWRNTATGVNVVWLMNGATMIGSAVLPIVTDQAWQLALAADLNGDGKPDLVWRNADGSNLVWFMNGVQVTTQGALPAVADPSWSLVGAKDLDGDGRPDLLWHNSVSGTNVVWFLSGLNVAATGALPSVTDQAWDLERQRPPRRPADFSGDGLSDIAWRNASTGANVVWAMNGTTISNQMALPPVADTAWRMTAIGDLNGDGRPDLVWRNEVTGADVIWYMNGTTIVSQAGLPTVPDLAWRLSTAADLDGDGRPDLVWRNQTTGANQVWFMNGSTIVSQASLPAVPDTNWRIMASADLNGDRKPDLIWQNSATGENLVWFMRTATVIGQGSMAVFPDPTWRIAGAGDIDGDGKPDVLWRNTQTGANAVLFMNGVTITGVAILPTVADTNWNPIR